MTNNYILRSILGWGKNTLYNHLLNMPWYKNARREKKIPGPGFDI